MTLWIRVLKSFGYYDDHSAGECFRMPLEHVNELVQKGYIEIVVNNMGNNKPFDEIEETFAEIVQDNKCDFCRYRFNKNYEVQCPCCGEFVKT